MKKSEKKTIEIPELTFAQVEIEIQMIEERKAKNGKSRKGD